MNSRTGRGLIAPAALRGAALLALALLAVVVAGCGTDGDVARTLDNQQQIRQAREEGAMTARQEERLKRLERELREGNGSQGATPAPPSGGTTPAPSAPGGDCGDGVTAGPNTSCPFARNVRDVYYHDGGGDIVIAVYSSVTGKTYTMSCHDGTTHFCAGGNNASVSF
jgi:hypothetical protein